MVTARGGGGSVALLRAIASTYSSARVYRMVCIRVMQPCVSEIECSAHVLRFQAAAAPPLNPAVRTVRHHSLNLRELSTTYLPSAITAVGEITGATALSCFGEAPPSSVSISADAIPIRP